MLHLFLEIQWRSQIHEIGVIKVKAISHTAADGLSSFDSYPLNMDHLHYIAARVL